MCVNPGERTIPVVCMQEPDFRIIMNTADGFFFLSILFICWDQIDFHYMFTMAQTVTHAVMNASIVKTNIWL